MPCFQNRINKTSSWLRIKIYRLSDISFALFSVESHHACYPRVDPVTMVLVVSPDEKSILLGRKAVFPPRFFTCLAGFMEPGESFETTVRREIYEESGLKVGNIRYQLSQCWPFPSSVMFGCSATAEDTNLKVDQEELEEVMLIAHYFNFIQLQFVAFVKTNPELVC